jgi:hypothetical protein
MPGKTFMLKPKIPILRRIGEKIMPVFTQNAHVSAASWFKKSRGIAMLRTNRSLGPKRNFFSSDSDLNVISMSY